jgi:soluble cytochrome b562
MKIQALFAVAVAAILAVPCFADDTDTPLSKEMSALNKAYRALKRGLADAAKKDENLALIEKMKVANTNALKYAPKMADEKSGAEKEKFIAEYKAMTEEMNKDIDALKAAVVGGKTEDAQKIVEKLDAAKKEGHEKFKKD